jgi:hypothetical protein
MRYDLLYLVYGLITWHEEHQVWVIQQQGLCAGQHQLPSRGLLSQHSINPVRSEFLVTNKKNQSVLHRKHITSPLQSLTG